MNFIIVNGFKYYNLNTILYLKCMIFNSKNMHDSLVQNIKYNKFHFIIFRIIDNLKTNSGV